MVDSFELEQEEEQRVVLVHALLTNHPVQRMLCGVLQPHVLSHLQRVVNGERDRLTFEMVKKKFGLLLN